MPEKQNKEARLVTIKVDRETRRLLKVIASTEEGTMVEVANRLTRQEAGRLGIKSGGEEEEEK